MYTKKKTTRKAEEKQRNGTYDEKLQYHIWQSQSVQAQSGVMVWFHKSISRTQNHTKYWSERNRITI
jgi:hypothetical protein